MIRKPGAGSSMSFIETDRPSLNTFALFASAFSSYLQLIKHKRLLMLAPYLSAPLR